MSLAGTSIAWLKAANVLGGAANVLGGPKVVGLGLFWLAFAAFIAFIAIIITYVCKAIRYPDAVRAEFNHPVHLAFLPSSTIALLLLATASQVPYPRLSAVLWWVGLIAHFALSLYVVSGWMTRTTIAIKHVTPAWFMTPVGMLVVPFAGVTHAPLELSWFAFFIGILFWFALLPIVFIRLFIQDQLLAPALRPTLAILVAPPAVGSLALNLLNDGKLTDLSRALFYLAVFFAALVVVQIGRLRKLPFSISWWAYGFPFAALATATTVMTLHFHSPALVVVAWVLLGAVSAMIALTAVRTTTAMVRGEICVPG